VDDRYASVLSTTVGRFNHLDGLRGVASLYVVCFHVWQTCGGPYLSAYPFLRWASGALSYGTAAVSVFIVLSGYSLTLPLARSGRDWLDGGFQHYIARRAKRILPPYYACLALSWLLLAVVPGWSWGYATEGAFESDVVLSHLLLVHQFSRDWIWKINAPLWSVGTEWTIYFLFPLLLIPALRIGGPMGAVFIGFAAGLAPAVLLPPLQNFWWAAPWYLGLFAFGMAAAVFQERARYDRIRRLPWGWFAVVAFGAFVAGLREGVLHWRQEALLGFAVACLLISLASRPLGFLTRLLSSGPMRGVGRFSFSLYLVHHPIEAVVHRFFGGLELTPPSRFALELMGALAASLPVAYGFFLLFERPTLSEKSKKPTTA
jgi:peptidoglycan/LPS O-acetylase OafA/YrhL